MQDQFIILDFWQVHGNVSADAISQQQQFFKYHSNGSILQIWR